MKKACLAKGLLLLLVVLLIAAALPLASCARGTTETGATIIAEKTLGTGEKTITFSVVDKENRATVFTLHTDATTLYEALEPHNLLDGEEGPYGLYVKSVNGILADYAVDGGWWCLYEGDQMANYGVETLSIEDGGRYSFLYKIG